VPACLPCQAPWVWLMYVSTAVPLLAALLALAAACRTRVLAVWPPQTHAFPIAASVVFACIIVPIVLHGVVREWATKPDNTVEFLAMLAGLGPRQPA